VAGIRNTLPIKNLQQDIRKLLPNSWPFGEKWKPFRDMQDVEFTIENANSGCCRPGRQADSPGAIKSP